MDKVYIRGLRAMTIIGIHEEERQQPREVVLDIEMATDAGRAAGFDRIDKALDYAAVSGKVLALVENSQYRLVETLGEEVARMLARDFAVSWLRLRVGKPGAVPQADDVGVIIERDRRQ